MTITYADTLGKHDITIPPDLIAAAEVPVLTAPQTQGDVGIWPVDPGRFDATKAATVPADGIAVVRGESTTGANSHILDAYLGDVWWRAHTATQPGDVLLGVLQVPEGSVAMLTHTDEHGSNGIGPGTYELTGKREQADIVRRVAD